MSLIETDITTNELIVIFGAFMFLYGLLETFTRPPNEFGQNDIDKAHRREH